MDMPRYLAEKIKELSGGLRVEVEPSPADIRPDHFIVQVENFWIEPAGTFQNVTEGDWTFVKGGIPVEGWQQALPVRVVWRSHCIGQTWRATMIEQTRKNAIMFADPFFVPAFGGKFTGESAELANDGQGQDLGNFEETNKDGPGLGFICMLERDPTRDKVFEPSTKFEKRNGYLAEQHFVGHLFFSGGALVPNDKRRSKQ